MNETPEKQQEQRARDADAAGGTGRRREELVHGGRGLAGQVELPDDRAGRGVRLVGGRQGGHQDEQGDERGEGLGREHDAPVEAGHPDEPAQASTQEGLLQPFDQLRDASGRDVGQLPQPRSSCA